MRHGCDRCEIGYADGRRAGRQCHDPAGPPASLHVAAIGNAPVRALLRCRDDVLTIPQPQTNSGSANALATAR